jgi:hypothetical protein
MSRLYTTVLFLLVVLVVLSGCSSSSDQPQSDAHAIYMLMDTSGTYTKELEQAQRVINYTLSELKPGDSFSLARIDTGSFSEKDIITKVTFDDRPSVSNEQKRIFQAKVNKFVKHVKGSSYTDITGGILQAIEYLNETGAGHKTILIFSDLKEDLRAGYVRKGIPLPLSGFKVVALNVTKLRSDNIDPRKYLARVKSWKQRVESNGGKWVMINDLQRLESILSI